MAKILKFKLEKTNGPLVYKQAYAQAVENQKNPVIMRKAIAIILKSQGMETARIYDTIESLKS